MWINSNKVNGIYMNLRIRNISRHPYTNRASGLPVYIIYNI